MKTIPHAMLLPLVLFCQPVSAQSANLPPAIEGKITEVTLYQGNALITREVELPADMTGAVEVAITPLPTATDTSSVYADQAENVEVRSVACRTRPTTEEEARKGRVAELETGIKELERKMSTARNEIALRRIRQDYLRDLGRFVAPSVHQEMDHGVIQAGEIEKVTRMHFTEYEKASQEIMKYDNEIEDDSELLAKMRQERDKLASGPPMAYDAIVFLNKPAAGPAKLRLNYLVKDCGWMPIYNMRGNSADQSVDIEFNAIIHQVSGEDWKDAKLTLSTASPTVSAYNPTLTPLIVRVGPALDDRRVEQSAAANAIAYNKAMEAKKEALRVQSKGTSMGETADAYYKANEFAASEQLIELSERLGKLRMFGAEVADEDMSIQYGLDIPVTLVSRREPQMVPVLKHKTKVSFYHIATPILTSAVYREAEMTNDTGRDLLGGRVNVYLDDEFIGRTDVPSIARGRSYTIGYGVDGQLRARRTLSDRVETVQGGNKQVALKTDIVVDNFKDKPVKLRLYERTPFNEDTSSLRVSVGQMSSGLSTDSDYQRFDKPKGILRWDLEVEPGSGDKAANVNYQYTLEFDKSLTLEEISNEQKSRLKREFINRSMQQRVKPSGK